MATSYADPAALAAGPAYDPVQQASIRARLVRPMPTDRLVGWLAPLAVTAVAALLRFVGLGTPKGVMFDEVYYAHDSYNLLRHGVELNKDNTGAGFIVHPPLGKWLLAAGQGIFGHNAFGWRFAAAVVGTLAVLVLARVARRLTRSTLLGCVAGLLLTLDGLEFVQSRVAMLDIFLMWWVLVAFACLVVDREVFRRRLADALDRDGPAALDWPGPSLGIRWWRVGAGLALAAAIATKWDGVFYLAAFGLLTLAWDYGARRTAGMTRPFWCTLRREALPLAAVLIVLPAVLYVASWAGWFAAGAQYAYDRNWAAGRGTSFGFVPESLRSWWHYQAEIWNFHNSLAAPHRYQSHPAGWLLLAKPVAYFYTSPKIGQLGCDAAAGCSREVLAIGTPAIWWASIGALVAMAWRFAAHRDWRAGAILLTVVIGIGAWEPSDLKARTEFLFYALPVLPFLVLALTMAAGMALGPAQASVTRRKWGAIGVGAYLIVVVLNFFGLPGLDWLGIYPILTAKVIPYSAWHAKMWFASWI